jgi:hypothetical protein
METVLIAKRAFVAFCCAFVTFVVVFLAIFVPLLIRDIHYAPHDGQGGMGGFFLGLPIAALAALISIFVSYGWMVRHRRFEDDAGSSKPDN